MAILENDEKILDDIQNQMAQLEKIAEKFEN
jgi:hypothetical protein